jgi:hypothetical protein
MSDSLQLGWAADRDAAFLKGVLAGKSRLLVLYREFPPVQQLYIGVLAAARSAVCLLDAPAQICSPPPLKVKATPPRPSDLLPPLEQMMSLLA